jgi:hypothetical protein
MPNIVKTNNVIVHQWHEVIIIMGHLGTQSHGGGEPSDMNVSSIDVIPNYPIDLYFCDKVVTKSIQSITERKMMLYRDANRLEERGGLKEPTLFAPRKTHRGNPLEGPKSKIRVFVTSRGRIC